MNGPVIRGRASICNWGLSFSFYDKEQCTKFIAAYLACECTGSDNIKYKVIRGDSLTLDVHIVTIRDGVWANNLTTIAKMLEDVDYKDDIKE